MLLLTASTTFLAWLFKALERATLPGIIQHYAKRKRTIEREVLTRLQSSAFSSVYILGAGFDTLALRIAANYPEVQFVELDHPATQAVKKLALADQALPANFEFSACDLRTAPVAQLFAELSPGQAQANLKNRLVIAEGLLMYFTPAQVQALLTAALAAESPGPNNNVCIFSYMEQTDSLPARFRPRSWLIDRWLAFKNEPFLWSANSTELAEVVTHAGGKIERLISSINFGDNVSADAIRGENLVVASST